MKKNAYIILLLLGFSAWLGACSKDDGPDEEVKKPKWEITTKEASAVDISKATISGEVTSKGIGNIEKVYFSYWEQGNLASLKKIDSELAEDGKTFSLALEELKTLTTYAYKPVVKLESTLELEGEILSFSTLVDENITEPVVKTMGVDKISYQGGLMKGELVSTGESNSVEYLFVVWEEDKEEQNFAATLADDGKTIEAMPTLNPNTTYNYKVVAINERFIGQGEVKQFTTGNRIYIDVNADGKGDGTTWEDAFTEFTSTISKIKAPDLEIWMAEGTYYVTGHANLWQENIRFYGGFESGAATLSDRDPKANETVIDGRDIRGSGNDMIKTNRGSLENPTLFDGLIFQNGKGGDGVALSADRPVVVKNCVFRENESRYGGAVIIFSTSATFEDCLFTNNHARGHSGAVLNVQGGGKRGDEMKILFERCKFAGNTANGRAGAVGNEKHGGARAPYYSPIFRDCQFVNNKSNNGQGGALSNWSEIFPLYEGVKVWENEGGHCHANTDGACGGLIEEEIPVN
ncbi:hypothetical protein FUAX_44020 (plasmid) [Fulvitalea axinellae]|uniref:Fibronectin type-III domain-containing protein n=1 Tax=Fulvitalea axinellae TaxID=1182444 RepID=A0AAU9DHD7_9BACT|nr:hypothetical protein FUAX_44020 [Fulvitalea axinellae]